jgi:lysophospholipid acyltransferase (LPLAT)-like uncharacterized protein
MFRRILLPRLILWFYRLWSATWRTTIIESPGLAALRAAGTSVLFAHWHRDELAVVQCVRRYRIATMTSRSKDGQLIDFVIRKLGGATSKGSSSRGGSEALRGLLRLMKSGYNGSIAVDGPRGPVFKAKPGAMEISKLAHCGVIPTGVASRRRHVFSRSWNQARLPLPFTRVVICFGDPVYFDGLSADEIRSPAAAARLEERIRACCHRARDEGLRLVGPGTRRPGGFGAPDAPIASVPAV